MTIIIRLANWWSGWRMDLDGYWVRARRFDDPDLDEWPELGFTEEACLAVRSPRIAFDIDRGAYHPEAA